MLILKVITLFLIFICSTLIGIFMASRYRKRVEEISEMKKALNMVETKMKFTYSPIPDTFEEVSKSFNNNVGKIFEKSCDYMRSKPLGEAWNLALDTIPTNLLKNDIDVLKGMAKLLGKTDIDGQISEIELTDNFLNLQFDEAKKALDKNEKVYKSLGVICGLALVIVLI